MVFGFTEGPPVHDPLCIAFLSHPSLFEGKRYRVDVELAGKHTAGTTSVDIWDYRLPELTAMSDPTSRESWGRLGKNVWVAESMDVRASVSADCVAKLKPSLHRSLASGGCFRRRWTSPTRSRCSTHP